jgi:hypothetical protein
METLLMLITILVPIITAITGLTKGIIPKKYQALVPLVIGLIIGLAYLPLAPGYTIAQILWAGGLAGLSAGGFYSVSNIQHK